MSSTSIESVLSEMRTFAPAAEFSKQAHVKSLAEYEALYARADQDPEGFWAERAGDLAWAQPWKRVLEWKLPDAKWFVGGKLNASVSCLDRHAASWRKNKAAILFEGEPGDTRVLTYGQLHREVCKAANALTELGIRAGDFVAIYLPMIPEAAIAMLACARIGAPHTVVFGGFSAEALRDRISDAQAKLVITADGGWRRGQVVPLKSNVDKAVEGTGVQKVLVVNRCETTFTWNDKRDVWWHETVDKASPKHEAKAFDSEHTLFTLYTSGTTGKPKGILHTTGGYLTGAAWTHREVFDLSAEEDVYWCSADVGWITGHSYIVYGPLANGATSVMYEGAPDYPDKDVWWDLCERYGVTLFYTAPTAIRACMKWGAQYPGRHDLSKLRLLGTVGEPINPKAWLWYHKVIGGGRCPIVDTWWQTETGAIMITTLPGAQATKPGVAGTPLPGIAAAVVDDQGEEVEHGTQGLLSLRRPWPAMLRGLYKDDDRYVETYWSKFGPETYFVGDASRQDDEGYVSVIGRVDDVINVSGHRLSTAEVESAIVSHPKVAEAACIGQSDEDTGQSIAAFVTLEGDLEGGDEMVAELRDHVANRIGKLARPKRIIWSDDLPKTRSGKIMRRLLKDIAEGRELGDVTTLRDPDVMAQLEEKVKSAQAEEA
jgi:acetyl-CoA synthetase